MVDAPTLEQQFERFGDDRTWAPLGLQIKLSSEPSSRLQIRNRARDRMIQVQNGRFHLNWLGQTGVGYPRYRNVRAEFDRLFASFCKFLAETKLIAARLNQWEVTYVNHIPRGALWNSAAELPKVVRLLDNPSLPPGASALDGFAGAWHFELLQQQGRLHVEVRQGRRTVPDDQEILVLTLTARGPLEEDAKGYDLGLTTGHEVIVRGFAAITTKAAQEFWERQDEE